MTSVVLFDLDDTLFDHRRAVDDGILAHLSSSDRAIVRRWHELEEEHYPRYLSGELDLYEQRRVRVRALAGEFDSDAAADAWYADYYLEYKRAWSLFDDAIPCLDALDAAGIRVGVITNGDAGFQQEKVEAVGLADRLEAVVASGSVGFAKPDPRIFLRACSELGVEPNEALYIGDRLQTDAIGAVSAGLAGVWIDRSGAASAAELEVARAAGVRVIHSLSELPALVR